ncbi:MAG: hypothetical protein N3B13_00860, partial [Deltaproteobacteria bacterium]|nr:hypothetical protein [Deltaproteobacteria bacterium]
MAVFYADFLYVICYNQHRKLKLFSAIYNLNSMTVFLRKSPFFLASVIIHLIILMLITLRLDSEILKNSLRNIKFVEVELIKQKTREDSFRSVIEYKAVNESKHINAASEATNRNTWEKSKNTMSSALAVNIITKNRLSEKKVVLKESNLRNNPIKSDGDAMVVSRILYVKRSDTEFMVKNVADVKPQMNIEAKDLKDRYEANPVNSGISTDNSHTAFNAYTAFNNNSPSFSEEMSVSQDYEIVRRMIEEKVNRFVPLIYQKKLLEKKKRTA